jgi:hypothetical protein
MLTYMTHPEHGTHIAYDHAEVERLQKTGWTVRTEKEIDDMSRKKPTDNPLAEIKPRRTRGVR